MSALPKGESALDLECAQLCADRATAILLLLPTTCYCCSSSSGRESSSAGELQKVPKHQNQDSEWMIYSEIVVVELD
ncbi:hypothetical protein GUJ93_ZPchr0003g17975 [Zizania palustris]|uniref:Uncharacterized protein n=1 Tax=Zizania palustris TaxID=103762 RepID=A0A8J5STM1_ZIZPA|nr:hypothetical protein GUJ93_ZPchr0003g17975 [Zizania palustris]